MLRYLALRRGSSLMHAGLSDERPLDRGALSLRGRPAWPLRLRGEQVSESQVASLRWISVGIKAMAMACVAAVIAVCDASGAPNANTGEPNPVFGPCGICHSVGPNARWVGPP